MPSNNENLHKSLPDNQENQEHRGRFLLALTIAGAATTVACFWKPAIIAAIPAYGWAVYEVRKIPELN